MMYTFEALNGDKIEDQVTLQGSTDTPDNLHELVTACERQMGLWCKEPWWCESTRFHLGIHN